MEITNNKVVELIYTLEVEGNVADQTTEENPLDFIFGTGSLLPEFEKNILKKRVGDNFDFKLSAANGYGEYDPEAIIELPKHIFEVDGVVKEDLLVVGNTIPMMNNMGGIMPGVVMEVLPEAVVMNFNHALAGKELHFTGKILTIREATEQELKDGLHGERKAHNCSEGGCSSCSGCH